MTRSVTVTADDLGLEPAVRFAVTALAGAGRIDAGSVLVHGSDADAVLADPPPVDLGLHVQMDHPTMRRSDPAEIRAVIHRQLQHLQSTGIDPTHLDLHTAALYGLGPDAVRRGGIAGEALDIAADHGLRFRLPETPPAGIPGQLAAVHRALVESARARSVSIPQALLLGPEQPVGGYEQLRAHYRDRLSRLPVGHSEVVLHPALSAGPEHDRARGWEYRFAASGDLDRLLESAGIQRRKPSDG